MIRVVVADDQPLVRVGLQRLLEHSPDIEVVGVAADGAEALQMTQSARPDVVLMDIRMPLMDGVAATRKIISEFPNARVIILTSFELDDYVFESLMAGASGFLGKEIEPESLREAIRVVAAGDALLTPRATRRLITRFAAQPPVTKLDSVPLATLTGRELDVMKLVGKGLSNEEIGRVLFMSSATARTHVGRTMRKLGVHDRAQLVVLAYQTGLVTPGQA